MYDMEHHHARAFQSAKARRCHQTHAQTQQNARTNLITNAEQRARPRIYNTYLYKSEEPATKLMRNLQCKVITPYYTLMVFYTQQAKFIRVCMYINIESFLKKKTHIYNKV